MEARPFRTLPCFAEALFAETPSAAEGEVEEAVEGQAILRRYRHPKRWATRPLKASCNRRLQCSEIVEPRRLQNFESLLRNLDIPPFCFRKPSGIVAPIPRR